MRRCRGRRTVNGWLTPWSSRADTPTLRPGWLFDSQSLFAAGHASCLVIGDRPKAGATRYRIYATDRLSMTSALIADAAFPLSSPTWGPDGHSLFYCRLVPQGSGTDADGFQGRCELVLQEALDRQRVIATLPGITLRRDEITAFCELKASWSPDGQYLAVPRPGRIPAILIVLPEQGRILKTLTWARLPSWSPESSRLIFVRHPQDESKNESLQVIGRDFGAARPLVDLNDMSEPASWSQDGQSVLVAARRPQGRTQTFELSRVLVDSGITTRAMVLVDEESARDLNRQVSPRKMFFPAENLTRGLVTLGLDSPTQNASQRVSLGFNRDLEQCVFAADLEGQVPVIGYNDIRDFRRDFRRAGTVLKKFHPLDFSLRIGSLALHPDDQVVAVRIDTLGGASPPLLCDLASMNVTLIAPDSCLRQQWLTTLAATAHGLLQTIPQPSLDGQPIERISVLPAPGELLEQNPMVLRLRRIGKVGRTLVDQPPVDQSSAAVSDETVAPPQDELRLFFDYLRGEYKDADTDLDAITACAATSDARFRLLAIRAQILHARDMTHQARAITDYLLKVQGGPARRVEETVAGMVFTPVDDSIRPWTRYLAQGLIDKLTQVKSFPGDNPADNEEGIDIRMPVPMDGFDGQINDNRFPMPQRRLGLADSLRVWDLDQGLPGWGAARWCPGFNARSVCSLRSRRNRLSRADRFPAASVDSIAPGRTPESD